ncbi:MAG: hypothetical protein QNI86_07975 [Halieaceae bacterium]|nr:hypothetical protein [Halieaceae bacterium]
MAKAPEDNLEIAMLPLSDGRQIMVPLHALAEVQQVNFAGRPAGDLGEFTWRGYELEIQSLDEVCGLSAPDPERLTTVGVFKADKDMTPPFRALAFSGTASPGRVEASWLTPVDLPAEGVFLGATRMNNDLFLIPDLPRILYGAS